MIFFSLFFFTLQNFSRVPSSQTFNSAVLARTRMRAELASDHTHQLYTYCQDYHSMTFEPFDPPNTQHTQRYVNTVKFSCNVVMIVLGYLVRMTEISIEGSGGRGRGLFTPEYPPPDGVTLTPRHPTPPGPRI